MRGFKARAIALRPIALSLQPIPQVWPYPLEPGATRHLNRPVQLSLLQRRVTAGEVVIGKKIGVTSQAVMDMLDVHQPDFGVLTDPMRHADGSVLDRSALIQPRAEGEIAFLLARDLPPTGVTEQDVLDATESVMACFEIVDSRIRDWKIRIQDTVADNASCGVFVLGDRRRDPRQADLIGCRMTLTKNGQVVSTGQGSATMGSPLTAMAWLANTLGALGTPLRAGEIVLSEFATPKLSFDAESGPSCGRRLP